MTFFTLHSAVTAPGSTTNEDAYGLWPNARTPRAAWVLDGVTGINDRPLLPGPTDAAWFVAQVQDELPALLAVMPERPIVELIARLVDALAARQEAAWLSPAGADGQETPAASFALFRHLGDQIEIARLGDCPVLLERADGAVRVLHDSVLSAVEADIKARVTAVRSQGVTDAAAVLARMMPFLRDVRRRRNVVGGYGVLAADRACLDLLRIDRFPASELRGVLLASDGYYRLVDVYGAMSDFDLLRRTAQSSAQELLAELRLIEAADRHGLRHLRLKMADDATALLLRRADD